MARKVLSELATVRMALEAAGTPGTAPSTLWTQLQPNPGGIQNFEPVFDTVERDPLSKYFSDEKGDNVGLRAEPKIVHDWNKDLMDLVATSMFRTNAKHPGGTALSFFRPTVVVDGGGSDDSYTVAASGDLAAGRLIFARGFGTTAAQIAANNGLKVVVASTGTAIKVATASLVAEASAPANATIDVVGVRGASADIVLTSGGNLTSTLLDFTTLNLVRGMAIIIGGEATANRFAEYSQTTPLVAYVAATPTANLITLEQHNFTVASGGAGTAKLIDLYFGRYFQNRPGDDADYIEPTLHAELEDIDAGTSGTVPTYTYLEGLALKTIELNAPLKSKIVATIAFCGLNIEDPVLTASRVSGPSTAFAPLATALFDTSTDLEDVRLVDANGALIAEINSWKLTIDNNVKPREVQGTFGAVDHIYGKFRPRVTMEAYFNDKDQTVALRDNRDMQWRCFIGNHQGGFCLRMPYAALRGGSKAYAANEAVMLSCEIPGFRDPATNVVASMTVFGFVPFGGDS